MFCKIGIAGIVFTLMKQKCRVTGQEFEITEEELEFYEKMGVPIPTLCPDERIKRRLNERNTRVLYYRTCDLSGKKILSQYHPTVPFPVYDSPLWWSDQWDGEDYSQDFNFEKPFFEQLLNLKNKVPHMSNFVIQGTIENSDYTNCVGYLKNCYLIFESDYDEDCYFCNRIYQSKNLVDCSNCYECELCYETLDSQNCYNLLYSQACRQCHDSYALFDCRACSDCIGCTNQRQKKYMIFNKQYSKEEYEEEKKSFQLDTHEGVESLKKQSLEFFTSQPHRCLQEEQNQNCVGDYLYNSKNSFFCYDCKDLEDCKYCTRIAGGVKSAMDYSSWGFGAELVYQASSCGDQIYNVRFCSTCTTNVTNATYCFQCTGCSDIFGCIGLKKKKYCILNKQYTKEEYEKLLPQIIEHMKKTNEWGEYFPKEFCSFGYNETLAQEYYPLTKEQALDQGYRWYDREKIEYTEQPHAIPSAIGNVSDRILDYVLACKDCGKNYKLQKTELSFYKKMGIPVPHECPDCRYAKRLAKRNPRKIWERKCDNCDEAIQTTFDPDRPEKVFCEKCYLASID